MSTYETRAGLVEIEPFDVVGLSVITDNTRAAEDINTLWERLFAERVAQNISGKTDDMIFAIYSDYEGDHEAPYRYTLGYRCRPGHDTPPDLQRVSIIDQPYAVLSAAGPQPQSLIQTWEAIWSGDLPRSFRTDFEIYGPRFFEEGLNEILIHVGIHS
jgi:predicted transcriptional regulator YdeE